MKFYLMNKKKNHNNKLKIKRVLLFYVKVLQMQGSLLMKT
jgi:hypothetical protein